MEPTRGDKTGACASVGLVGGAGTRAGTGGRFPFRVLNIGEEETGRRDGGLRIVGTHGGNEPVGRHTRDGQKSAGCGSRDAGKKLRGDTVPRCDDPANRTPTGSVTMATRSD